MENCAYLRKNPGYAPDQSVKVPSENRILSLNSVANSCKRKAVQTKINAMGVTENKHF